LTDSQQAFEFSSAPEIRPIAVVAAFAGPELMTELQLFC
jgi:hypothetical protein